MSKQNDDWEEVLSRLTHEREIKKSSGSTVGAVVSGILAFCLINGATAVAIMVINQVLVGAWPDMTSISPGIGYQDAFIVTSMLWVVFFVRLAVILGMDGRNNADKS